MSLLSVCHMIHKTLNSTPPFSKSLPHIISKSIGKIQSPFLKFSAVSNGIPSHPQSQLHDLKQAQSSESSQLHSLMVDPAVNVMFSSMKKQLKEYKEKLEHAQNDLSAWKFTPDRLSVAT